MKLCIAEKPSVAREIAKILGANLKRNGYFEGNGYFVSWTFGHLCTLNEPHDYKKDFKRWQINHLPIIPEKFGIKLKDNQGIAQQFAVIEELVGKSEMVINCGDAGQEGELIQRWVLQKAKCKIPVKRLWISSLTNEAIKEGFSNLKPSENFDNLYAAGSLRAIGDWLLGFNATRLYTLKYGGYKQLLSIGRVQTPTLALIVNRQKEMDNFKPEKYWELTTIYKETVFSSVKLKYKTIEEAQAVIDDIKEKEFEITDFTIKKGKEHPPKLFDLTSLQVEANKKFNFSADQTLKVIQSLYEKKLTSYPRVDTTYLPDDVYPKVEAILKKLTPYKEFIDPLLKKKIRKSKKVFDDKKVTDHHAIIPTGNYPEHLNQNEKLVYDLVSRHFIAAFMPDAQISNTTVLGKVEKVKFSANGKQILEPGWRVIFPKKSNAQDKILPHFEKGEKGPHLPSVLEKNTTPPKAYTEATLLRAMETAGKHVTKEALREAMKENGIGRPSTRAGIIETLFNRHYIERQRKNLVPTKTGIELIGVIENELLKSPELTGVWEKKLREIEKGEYEPAKFMEELKAMVSELVNTVKQSRVARTIAHEVVEEKVVKKSTSEILCPKCKVGKIVKGKSSFGCVNFKNCDFKVPFEIDGKKVTTKKLKELCVG
ncbi:DNA topoisomerase III [Candidatus Peregrinibacteria bacterium CG10_big_fil_rev_8_21_14_0_10_36_19]|nr:MAG: DNA topoisomerase III [Candidatus Peregrinibacteria bacterium CG10_big_fil_rev_8_21_14_0_10_36_19]